ncbi:RNA polymerase sigma factor [Chitinophaga agrisoli]|nr:RNA polymerase sigma factor [Chitinophaga agrisoli]
MTIQPDIITSDYSDEQLLARILGGEKKLFEVIIRRYNQRLYRVGMSILGNDTEAEDAMQTAYISAYEHLAQFEGRSSLATWLTRIMINQCHQQQRKTRPVNSNVEPSDNFVNMQTPAHVLANKELSAVLEQAITRLPEKYRLVFVLREMEDMSVRETSAALNIEETNVKVRLNRAKTMLRENLNSYMKDHVFSFHLSRCDKVVQHVMQHLGIV